MANGTVGMAVGVLVVVGVLVGGSAVGVLVGATVREERRGLLGLELLLPVHVADEVNRRLVAWCPAATGGDERQRYECPLHASTAPISRAPSFSSSSRVFVMSNLGSRASTLTMNESSLARWNEGYVCTG